MKTLKKLSVLCFSCALSSMVLNAQLNEVDFITGGIEDAQILFKEYLAPYANAFGANLNGGWYNTAKPHKLGGFDVTLTFNAAWAPPSARTMDLTKLGLDAVVSGPGNGIAPTVAGKKVDDRPVLSYFMENPTDPGNPLKVAEYEVPNGTGVNIVPLPMAQLGIGLPLGTDLTVRFLPSIDLGNTGSIGLWGIGLKHSILQHIPVLKKVPVIDASIQGGYTKLSTFANINLYPDTYDFAVDLITDPLIFKEQKIVLDVQALTVNLVASQTLPVVTFYEGIGYSSSSTRIALNGKYPLAEPETDPDSDYYGQVVVKDESVVEDPFDVEIENTRDLRLNAGMRIKLGVLTIHFDYTKANYSVVTGGLGISFR